MIRQAQAENDEAAETQNEVQYDVIIVLIHE